MTRNTLALALALAALTGGGARGQYPPTPYGGGPYPNQSFGQQPGVNGGQLYPSIPGTAGIPLTRSFNPPLSPYLNLLRGGDPAINYYYAVRPALSLGASPLGSLTTAPSFGYSQLRNGFLPAAANPTQEPTLVPAAGVEIPSLPPSGHPVSYGGLNRFTPSASRPSFLGNAPPPPAKKRQ